MQLEDQGNRLIKMLVGTNDLDTFLAGLNLLSVTNQVSVVLTQPGEIEAWLPPVEPENGMEAGLASSSLAEEVSPSGDALLQEGIEKRSASISVEGTFDQVQGFLRDLEGLEVFVIANDLAMESVRVSGQGSSNEAATKIKMKLRLSAYGRAVEPVSDKI